MSGTAGGSDLGGQIIFVNVCMNVIIKHYLVQDTDWSTGCFLSFKVQISFF